MTDKKKEAKQNKTGIRSVTEMFKTMFIEAIRDGSGSDKKTVKVKAPAKAYRGKRAAAAEKQARRDSFSKLVAVFFVLMIFGVMISGFIVKDMEFSPDENRMLQEKPELSAVEYMEGRLERKVENYVSDQFPGRNRWVRIKSAMDMTAGKLEVNGVYKCRDGYLMEAIKAPDSDNISDMISALGDFKERYPDMSMYFLLAPNAANILDDKLPATVRMRNQDKYIDSFYEELVDCGYTTIDVRDDFTEHRKDTQLYYRTDHHWTTEGAYMAYRRAAEEMGIDDSVEYRGYVVKNDFNGTLYSKSGYTNGKSDEIKIYFPADEDEYLKSVIYYADSKEKTTEFYQLENLKTKDAYSVFGGSNHPVYTVKTPSESGKKLLLVKDSYANSFIPFLSQNYREVVVVDPRYYYENIDDLMQAEGVTDVMFLYNANTLFEDDSLQLMLSAEEDDKS